MYDKKLEELTELYGDPKEMDYGQSEGKWKFTQDRTRKGMRRDHIAENKMAIQREREIQMGKTTSFAEQFTHNTQQKWEQLLAEPKAGLTGVSPQDTIVIIGDI